MLTITPIGSVLANNPQKQSAISTERVWPAEGAELAGGTDVFRTKNRRLMCSVIASVTLNARERDDGGPNPSFGLSRVQTVERSC